MGDYHTVAQAFKVYRDQRGEEVPVFVFRDRQGGRQVFTYGRLHRLGGRCAALFRSKGIRKGSRVMLCLDNSPERLVCELGLLYAGAVCINGLCQIPGGSDLLHLLRHSRADVILLDPDVTNTPWTPLRESVTRAVDGTVTSDKLPDLKRVEFVQRRSGRDFVSMVERSSDWFMEDGVQMTDDCFVFTTSGTSGLPKMAVHTHENFVPVMKSWARNVSTSGSSTRHVRYQDTHLGTSGGNITVTLMLDETRVLWDVRAGVPEDRAAFVTRCIREEKCTKAALLSADVLKIEHRVKLGAATTTKPVLNNHYNDEDGVKLGEATITKPILNHNDDEVKLEAATTTKPVLNHNDDEVKLEAATTTKPVLSHNDDEVNLEAATTTKPVLNNHQNDEDGVKLGEATITKPILNNNDDEVKLEAATTTKPVLNNHQNDEDGVKLGEATITKPILNHNDDEVKLEAATTTKPVLNNHQNDEDGVKLGEATITKPILNHNDDGVKLGEATTIKPVLNNHHNKNEEDLASSWREIPLDQISIGGQPVTRRVVDAALDLAQTVLVYYGATELGVISMTLTSEKGRYEDYNVGRPVPGVSVKVIDEQMKEEVSVGQIGQVLIRHPLPFTQYLRDPDDPTAPRRADAFTPDGFYLTGDRGKINPDDSLTIFGRIGDSIIMRGNKVYYPHAIESSIKACAGIDDVVVVGVPDPEVIEEFCACVVLEEGANLNEVEAEVEKKFTGPDVTSFSLRPRYYLKFESLPLLYTGRHNRRQVKEMARKRLMLKFFQ
ncbi:hypothetical protein ACOMHN_023646 [Nucella lapillus]